MYDYPISINRNPQVIDYTEQFCIYSSTLTLKDLQFIGNDKFSISDGDSDQNYDKYTITVYRSRFETNAEMYNRIAQEESYMNEYNKRNKS